MTVVSQKGCTISQFGTLPDGRNVELYTLLNSNGMSVSITTYGATVVSVCVPDKNGIIDDVTLGFDSVDGYLQDGNPFIGATIGRYGNRIAKGKFQLNGKEYTLATNNGVNHLHGGPGGFDKVLWQAVEKPSADATEVSLFYISNDGEEGYPGTLKVTVRFVLTDNNELQFCYSALSDADTIINLTNHSYFNLGREATIENHILKMNAEWYTPVDETQIPTGEIVQVDGTPFDFLTPRKIGDRINSMDNEQIRFGGGYDHNFIIDGTNELKQVASVLCLETGRILEVVSTEPGVQFYSGNFLDGSIKGKDQKPYGKRAGFCLETQHYPDSPNKQSFPTTVLKAGEQFKSTTINRFSVADSLT